MGVVDLCAGLLAGKRYDDDTADRLNHRYTTVLLLTFAIIVFNQQFIYGSRIVCWVPAHFSDIQEAYVQEYCWVRNTYYLSFNNSIPREHESNRRNMITYYQWVPIILCFQALLFNLPCILWRNLNVRSGLDLSDFIDKSKAVGILDEVGAEKLQEKTMKHLVYLMNRFAEGESRERKSAFTLSIKNLMGSTCLRPFRRSHGRYLVGLYIFCKLLYLANVIGQLFLMDRLLQQDFHSYGFTAVQDYLNDDDYGASLVFPRITLCDFMVRRLGNLQRYTVQCALPINLFNEKFFLAIYFWMLLVAVLTGCSLIHWLVNLVSSSRRKHYISRNILHAMYGDSDYRRYLESQSDVLRAFVEKYLKQDGILALRMTGKNVDPVAEADLIFEVWTAYLAKRKKGGKRKDQGDDSDGEHSTPQATRRRLYPRLSQIDQGGDSADATA